MSGTFVIYIKSRFLNAKIGKMHVNVFQYLTKPTPAVTVFQKAQLLGDHGPAS